MTTASFRRPPRPPDDTIVAVCPLCQSIVLVELGESGYEQFPDHDCDDVVFVDDEDEGGET
jgi:hypothetical protein